MAFYGPLRLADPSSPSTGALPGQTGYTAFAPGQQFTLGGGPQAGSQDYLPFLVQQIMQRFPGAGGFTSYPGANGGGTSALGFTVPPPLEQNTIEGLRGQQPESITGALAGTGSPLTLEDLIVRTPIPGGGVSQVTPGSQSSLAPPPIANIGASEMGSQGDGGGINGGQTGPAGITGGLGALADASSNQSLAVAGLNAVGINPSNNFAGIPDINVMGRNVTPTNQSVANSLANNALSINGVNVGALANLGFGAVSALNNPSSMGAAFSVNGQPGFAVSPGQSFFSMSPTINMTNMGQSPAGLALANEEQFAQAVPVATGNNIGFGGPNANSNVSSNFAEGTNMGPQGQGFGLSATNPSIASQSQFAFGGPRANDPVDAPTTSSPAAPGISGGIAAGLDAAAAAAGVTGGSGASGPSSGGVSGGVAGAADAAAAAAGAGGGAGDGGGGTVICTVLHDFGWMSDEVYAADQQFGQWLPSHVLVGYQTWARPVAKAMRRSRLLRGLLAPIAVEWAKEMAYVMGVREKGSFIGRLIMAIGLPVCDRIGQRATRSRSSASAA